MEPGLQWQPQLYGDDKSNEVMGLDLNLPGEQIYPFNCPIDRSWPIIYETRNPKRLKLEHPMDESIGSNSSYNCSTSNSLTSLTQFRDHVWAYTQRYLAIEAMEEAAVAMLGGNDDEIKEEEGGEGMKLVQQLIACAEAVACQLRANALVFGTSFQRVASCFVQGLADRLALVQPLGAVGVVRPVAKAKNVTLEKDEALSLVYELCPQIKFGHFVANESIVEAFEGESFVHVVDLGMTLGLSRGHQWRNLMQCLVHGAGQPPNRLRITGVGTCPDRLQAIGDDLEQYAKSLRLNFKFSVVESNLENLKPEDFNTSGDEALVINSILQLHCVVKESRGALNSVLQKLHELSPKLLILIEQDSSHNGPFFLGRFMEALHYYSAIFDSLDTMLPKYDTRRAKMEQFYFAEEIKNIVSCEGPGRIERHERVDQWRRRMRRAGFQPAPIKMKMQAKQWVGKAKVCEGYTIVEDKGCLLLGWKSKPIIAASCWK
ncbi:hypothetical protein CRYUN_Cryun04dG0155000 [Craigia yunnanensis]